MANPDQKRLDHFLDVIAGVIENAPRIINQSCPDFKPASRQILVDPDFIKYSYKVVIFCGACKGKRGKVVISGTVGDDVQPEVTLPEGCMHKTQKVP